tara:strand:- start:11964 stop:12848 length:885 start_codon:yes stop_codon:yes gene_type:complete
MKHDKISVIIPSNNSKNWKKIIKNLSSNKINYEIIFIGPKQNSAINDKNIKIIQSFLKPVQCLQIGLINSSGNYLMQMADDCLLKGAKDPLFYIYQKAKKFPKRIVSCKYSVSGIPVKKHEYNYLPWNNKTNLPIAPLIKKSDVLRLGGYDKNFIAVLSDIDLYLRLKQINKKIYYCNLFIDEDKIHNKSNNLLPTYWNHDRVQLDNCWIKKNKKKKLILSKKRLKKIQRFDNKLLELKKPQGLTGKWKFNNYIFFTLINNKVFKSISFLLTLSTNTRFYYFYKIKNKLLKKIS